MTFARTVACLVASAAVLTACSKPPASDAASAAATTNTVANTAANTAGAHATSDTVMPDMKPGLWEIHMNHTSGAGEGHGGVTQQCLELAAMAQAKKTAADYAKANCSKNETQRDGDKWVNNMVCTAGGSTMTTHTVTAMVGDGAYHTDLTTTYDPPIAGQATSSTTMDGKWISECKPA
jgi:hypothetical protein